MNATCLSALFLFLAGMLSSAALSQSDAPSVNGARPAPDRARAIGHRDLAYTSAGHDRQKLDLFVPEKGDGPFPLIVWIHGGGWASGDKSGCPPLASGYLDRGFAVASLNYRLSGDAVFPAQIEDCKAAIRWLREHAKEFRLDSEHIGVWGSSAGGHLVALLGTSDAASGFDVGENLDQSSRVQAVSDYYGPTDFIQMDAHAAKGSRLVHDARHSPESRLVGGPIQEQANLGKVQLANPITHITEDDPPFLIVHGNQDPAVPFHQSELLHAALAKAGVPTRFITVDGGGHGQGFPGTLLNPIVAEFFDRHLQRNNAAADWPVVMTTTVAAIAEPSSAAPATPAARAPSRAAAPPPERRSIPRAPR